jgi:hypothetical protein
MIDVIELGREFFERLTTIDREIVERAAEERCRDCGGPLHRGDYPRKPRAGLFALAAGAWERRFSLCCGREGCRHRATPPSVRFLGRRVYAGAVLILVSAVALAVVSAGAVVRATGVPALTTRRWLRWWRGPFVASAPFVDLSACLIPAPDRRSLPTSLLDRLASDRAASIAKLLGWLAPLTTASRSRDGSRWLRGAM